MELMFQTKVKFDYRSDEIILNNKAFLFWTEFLDISLNKDTVFFY